MSEYEVMMTVDQWKWVLRGLETAHKWGPMGENHDYDHVVDLIEGDLLDQGVELGEEA